MTLAFLSGVARTEPLAAERRVRKETEVHHERTPFRARVFTSAAGLEAIAPDWQVLHQRSGDTVFQTYEWLSTWYRLVESRLPVRVLACWDGDKLVGIFPFSVQPINLGLLRINRLRFACEHGVYGEFAPLVDSRHLGPCAVAAAEYLGGELGAGEVDFCDFGAFRVDSPIMVRLADELAVRGLSIQSDPKFMPRIAIQTSHTWDDYLKGLKSSHRRELKRDMRAIDHPDVTFEAVRDPEAVTSVFHHLIALHTASWKRRGAGGHFLTDEFFEEFLSSVTPLLMRRGKATLFALKYNGKPIVVTLNFHSGRYYAGYITGRDLDSGLSTLSPGRAVFGMCIKDAVEGKFSEFDFLGGAQQYKLELGGTLSYYGRLIVRLDGPAGFVARLASALLEARYNIHIKFYRHRVLPKLNKMFRGPATSAHAQA